MPKTGMQEQRRQELIEATLATIHRDGYSNTALSRIAQRAGLSAGLVAHYFNDKDGLLEATMRHLARSLGDELRRRLHSDATPLARLDAVVEANFASTYYRPESISAWLAFWAQVNHAPRLSRVQDAIRGRLESNLRAPLRALVGDAAAPGAARSISVMIDGLWLRSAMTGGGFGREEALAMARQHVKLELAAAAAV